MKTLQLCGRTIRFLTMAIAILFLHTLASAAEQVLPEPPGLLDSLVHPEFGDSCYSSNPNSYFSGPNKRFMFSQNVGDFDGDGSDDIYAEWNTDAKYYTITNTESKTYFKRYCFGVYSVTKSRYLFAGIRTTSSNGNVITGDFNNDGKIDFVVGTRIYLGVNSVSKKKVFP